MANTIQKTRTQDIMTRIQSCGCGCHGRDPWHKSSYRRIVRQTSATEGVVRLPMSTRPARVSRTDFGNGLFGMWIVDRDSIVFDK